MVRHHHSPNRTCASRMALATLASDRLSWRMVTLLAMCGLLLLLVGIMERPSHGFLPNPGWLYAHSFADLATMNLQPKSPGKTRVPADAVAWGMPKNAVPHARWFLSGADRRQTATHARDRRPGMLQPAEWDLRWSVTEMASAQRDHWEQRCPCPVYASHNPDGGPR
jgi:hypothetical protein